jgi:hypothetical protein
VARIDKTEAILFLQGIGDVVSSCPGERGSLFRRKYLRSVLVLPAAPMEMVHMRV